LEVIDSINDTHHYLQSILVTPTKERVTIITYPLEESGPDFRSLGVQGDGQRGVHSVLGLPVVAHLDNSFLEDLILKDENLK
jgi:hypothetical protein